MVEGHRFLSIIIKLINLIKDIVDLIRFGNQIIFIPRWVFVLLLVLCGYFVVSEEGSR